MKIFHERKNENDECEFSRASVFLSTELSSRELSSVKKQSPILYYVQRTAHIFVNCIRRISIVLY